MSTLSPPNEKIYVKAPVGVSPGTITKLCGFRFLVLRRDERNRRFFRAFDLDRARESLDNVREVYKYRGGLLGKLRAGRIDDTRAHALWLVRDSEAAMVALETAWGWRGEPGGAGGAT